MQQTFEDGTFMALSAVSEGDPHVAAHNNERTAINGLLSQVGTMSFWTGTQAQYDAITTKVATTLYIVHS